MLMTVMTMSMSIMIIMMMVAMMIMMVTIMRTRFRSYIMVETMDECKHEMPCGDLKRFEAARSAAEESSIYIYIYI